MDYIWASLKFISITFFRTYYWKQWTFKKTFFFLLKLAVAFPLPEKSENTNFSFFPGLDFSFSKQTCLYTDSHFGSQVWLKLYSQSSKKKMHGKHKDPRGEDAAALSVKSAFLGYLSKNKQEGEQLRWASSRPSQLVEKVFHMLMALYHNSSARNSFHPVLWFFI